MRRVFPLVVGLLFALGLGLAGMTLPASVLAFLELRDPGLLLTMGGAAAVTLLGFPLVLRRERPVHAPRFVLPTRRDIDRPLVVGAAVFGVGWGLVGLCPGPALTGLAGGSPQVLLFVLAMLAGMSARYFFSERSSS
ncbi:MAG: YeeE/YedE family protein [Myxococcales bacterium]|nr:YeeE/YedE family protein [Myxococcales bacterium]